MVNCRLPDTNHHHRWLAGWIIPLHPRRRAVASASRRERALTRSRRVPAQVPPGGVLLRLSQLPAANLTLTGVDLFTLRHGARAA